MKQLPTPKINFDTMTNENHINCLKLTLSLIREMAKDKESSNDEKMGRIQTILKGRSISGLLKIQSS